MKSRILLLALVSVLSAPAAAAEKHAFLKFGDIEFKDAHWPAETVREGYQSWEMREEMRPYVACMTEGAEIFANPDEVGLRPFDASAERLYLAAINVGVSAKTDGPVAGRLYFPNAGRDGMEYADFTIPAMKLSDSEDARMGFLRVKRAHYRMLAQQGLPGGAWFRHKADEATKSIGDETTRTAQLNRDPAEVQNRMDQTYDLVNGGRALAENLQLDRSLNVAQGGKGSVPIDSIPGVKFEAFDYKPLIAGKKPAHDTLAAMIPADRHALFFPNFNSLTRMLDEADARGTPVFGLLDAPSDDAACRARYEKQLGIGAGALARLLGPALVTSVAITGSDPYLRMGSDIAILFESPNPVGLTAALTAERSLAVANRPDAEIGKADAPFGSYNFITTPDRAVSSFCATLGPCVVVTNSRALLELICKTYKREIPDLGSTDEYAFFRDRHPRGSADETALLILSDATIRRWCGPRWRIADSRRARAAAELAELQAANLASLAAGKIAAPAPLASSDPGLGAVTLAADGVHASAYGGLNFMTPIVEMEMNTATEAEAQAYGRFRDNYQWRWRRYFDPIAIKFTADDKRLAADMTVMPLISGTDYAEFIAFTSGAELTPQSGDPHKGALSSLLVAINPESPLVKQGEGMLTPMGFGSAGGPGAPNLNPNPLGWLGGWLTLYADADPFWDGLEKARAASPTASEKYFENNFNRLPVALEIASKNGFKLAGFLTMAHAFIEQSAPGMAAWETRMEGTQPYVRVGPTRQALAQDGQTTGPLSQLGVYYAALPDRLIVTLNENVLKQAIARAGKKADAPARDIMGRHVEFEAEAEALGLYELLYTGSMTAQFQNQAWNNIPILNEWRREFGAQDPVAFHARLWGLKLLCPGGGQYVWDEEFKTMKSTVYGCPARPQAPAAPVALLRDFEHGAFGLSFENQGVRARAELRRAAPRP